MRKAQYPLEGDNLKSASLAILFNDPLGWFGNRALVCSNLYTHQRRRRALIGQRLCKESSTLVLIIYKAMRCG